MSDFQFQVVWLFAVIQFFVGVCIFVGATRVLLSAVDQHSSRKKLLLWVTMQASGAWYGLDPLLVGSPTPTLPGILFSALVAWILIFHWKVVHAVVEGRCTLACIEDLYAKPTMSMWPAKH
ncbi:hypothetical protein UFOVP1254_92 [uncultured Caudovirales phage]|uniref:Uncharacterized protein n=1 Tax=uncultured Caudovirales phage TaxID=2100421 RepID=A0A6J5RBE2_9CAUD|nr:hypothetical protein UFOVP1254_92 [uncultured Caudovirales phage]